MPMHSRSTAGSELEPDIPLSLVATLLWQLACCGYLTVVGHCCFQLLLEFWEPQHRY